MSTWRVEKDARCKVFQRRTEAVGPGGRSCHRHDAHRRQILGGKHGTHIADERFGRRDDHPAGLRHRTEHRAHDSGQRRFPRQRQECRGRVVRHRNRQRHNARKLHYTGSNAEISQRSSIFFRLTLTLLAAKAPSGFSLLVVVWLMNTSTTAESG